MTDPECPKCRSRMEPGFLVDHTHGAVARSEWASGEPRYSMWTGMKMKGRERYQVVTHRCPGCGFLEAYARERTEE